MQKNKTLIALALASLAAPLAAADAPAAPSAVASAEASVAAAAQASAAVAAKAVDAASARPRAADSGTAHGSPSSEAPAEASLDSVVNGLAASSETAGEVGESDEKSEENSEQNSEENSEESSEEKAGEGLDERRLGATPGQPEAAGEEADEAQGGAAELRSADAVAPLAIVPPFLDFMPYVTTLRDVEEVFGKNARLYDEGRYGKRHIITGQDFELGVTSILVYYTDGGLLSDVFLRIPAKERARVLEALKAMTPSMNPEGIWAEEDGRDYWRTKTAELSVSPVKGDDFTVEYGATARQIRETRAWIEADPAHRAPRFAGLSIGISTADDVKAKADGKRCRILGPSLAKDGSSTYALSGPCFGVPGEYQSLAWIAADSGRLTRLFLQSRGDAVGFASVLPALQKRYKPTGRPGEFEAGEAPARNVWPAVIRFTPYRKAAGGTVEEGTLEFYAGIDGVKKEEAVWDRLLEEKKAREAQAKAVDSLFE